MLNNQQFQVINMSHITSHTHIRKIYYNSIYGLMLRYMLHLKEFIREIHVIQQSFYPHPLSCVRNISSNVVLDLASSSHYLQWLWLIFCCSPQDFPYFSENCVTCGSLYGCCQPYTIPFNSVVNSLLLSMVQRVTYGDEPLFYGVSTVWRIMNNYYLFIDNAGF